MRINENAYLKNVGAPKIGRILTVMKETQTNEVTLTKESHVNQIIDYVEQHKNELYQLFDELAEEPDAKLDPDYWDIWHKFTFCGESVLTYFDYDDFSDREELTEYHRLWLIGLITGILFKN
jgi:uncharacterized membrane protein YjjP (DUF1212 family)